VLLGLPNSTCGWSEVIDEQDLPPVNVEILIHGTYRADVSGTLTCVGLVLALLEFNRGQFRDCEGFVSARFISEYCDLVGAGGKD
jgi:hypothetical protein